MPSTPPVIFVYTCLPPPVNTLTGGVENYVGGVKKFRGASHPPQANLCTRPWIYSIVELDKVKNNYIRIPSFVKDQLPYL